MSKKKRILTALLAIAVFFVMLCSVLYIAAEADHDCIGENCPICQYIVNCQNILSNLSLAAGAALFTAALAYSLCRVIFADTGKITNHTLVTLKVKISN